MGSAVLWGRDHVEYGEVEAVSATAGVAVALTRGLHPKPYRWTDPNEDVVAAVVGPRATLLVVADGHNGATASAVAVRVVLDRIGQDPPPDLTEDDVVDLFVDATGAVLAATRALDDERRQSRTTLSVALVADQRLRWAAMGDSPVMVLAAGTGRELTWGTHDFVGWPVPRRVVDRLVQRGRARLAPDAWVAVTSDGFSNYTRVPADAAAEVCVGAADARTAAEGLVARAFEGGAGDNVAAVVVAPPSAVDAASGAGVDAATDAAVDADAAG